MIENMVIANWYEPDKRLPEEGVFTIVTFSGRKGNIRYDHTFGVAEYYNDGVGWTLDGYPEGIDEFVIHAWCDLEPWKG